MMCGFIRWLKAERYHPTGGDFRRLSLSLASKSSLNPRTRIIKLWLISVVQFMSWENFNFFFSAFFLKIFPYLQDTASVVVVLVLRSQLCTGEWRRRYFLLFQFFILMTPVVIALIFEEFFQHYQQTQDGRRDFVDSSSRRIVGAVCCCFFYSPKEESKKENLEWNRKTVRQAKITTLRNDKIPPEKAEHIKSV